MRIREAFNEFRKIPKGLLISRPDELIATSFFTSTQIKDALFLKDSSSYFTRRSLKHLAEKGASGERLLESVREIFRSPETIRRSKRNRYLISKYISPDRRGRSNVVVVERTDASSLVIITLFTANKKYLKNFKILWRTATQ